MDQEYRVRIILNAPTEIAGGGSFEKPWRGDLASANVECGTGLYMSNYFMINLFIYWKFTGLSITKQDR